MPEVTSDETMVEIDDTESLTSTEEICNPEECFLFKSIQKPQIHQAYYSEKGKFNLILESIFHLIFWLAIFIFIRYAQPVSNAILEHTVIPPPKTLMPTFPWTQTPCFPCLWTQAPAPVFIFEPSVNQT